MRCSCCGREIKSNENFYEIEEEFYCDDCIEEETITLYQIKYGDEPYHEDDVGCYLNRKGLIDNINEQIRFFERRIERDSVKDDERSKNYVMYTRTKIQELERKKERILEDEEEEE